MTVLETLRENNQRPVFSVRDAGFRTYGRILTGYETEGLFSVMEEMTEIPEEGNVYVPSFPALEEESVMREIEAVLYGGEPVQAGYCNGRNSTFNGFEYHKGSEINIAVTDFALALGHVWDIRDNTYHNADAEVFFVERGTVIELYQTTLHLSPLRVTEDGFRNIVILPKGTNTPLSEEEKAAREQRIAAAGETDEARLLLQKNKWVIAHPEREPLMKQGAYPGIIGENTALIYH